MSSTDLLRARRAAIVATARAWIGTPYHHQASRKGVGTDCLGLVRGVWRDIHGQEAEQPGPYTRDWSAPGSGVETLLEAARRHMVDRSASQAPPQPAEVLVFRYRPHLPARHCGIATGEESFVHALEGAGVIEVPLSGWWQRRIAGVFAFPGVTD